MISTLDLIRLGVRFDLVPEHGFTIRVRGPRDADVQAKLREAVNERVPLLSDLPAARRCVLADWPGPWATRSGVDKETKQPWSYRLLPDGVCETCGRDVCAIRNDKVYVEGGGMCSCCLLARQRVLALALAA